MSICKYFSALCLIVITSQSLSAARLFRSKDDGGNGLELQLPLELDARAASDDKSKNLVDDLVIARDCKSNCEVQGAKTNKLRSISLKALKSKAVNIRRKRSDKQIIKSKRRRSPTHYRNDVLVPYVPLNLYTYQHQSEYVSLDEVIFEEEPKHDPEILGDESKYDPVIVDEKSKHDLVIYEEEPKYDPNNDLRLIFDSIDAKFKKKVEKKKKVKNSIVEKWLKILAKKRKALFWMWKKKFSKKGYTDGILYAEEIRHPKIAKDAITYFTRPSSPKQNFQKLAGH